MRFQDKVVIVTGGNYGIGRGIAQKFGNEGAKIAVVARNQERSDQVVNELNESDIIAKSFKTDLSQEGEVIKLIEDVIKEFGQIDILVNNAGLGSQNSGVVPTDPPGKRWELFRGSNMDSTYFMCAHALSYLSKQSNSTIINISSTATFHGNWGLYGAAKAGVEGMTRSFAAEGALYGIRVNAISPGWIETSPEQTANAQGDTGGYWAMPPSLLNRMGTPEEIANTAAFLASNESSFITGQTLIVDGGLMIMDYPSMSSLETVGHRVFSHSK